MSDNESLSSEALHTPPLSSGISPDVRKLSMLDEQGEADDDDDEEFSTESTASHPLPTASSFSSPSSEDDRRQIEHVKEVMRQQAVSNPDSYPPILATSSSPASSSAPSAPARKPSAAVATINQQVAAIIKSIDQAFREKAPQTDLPWPKHPVSLPTDFVSIALPVAEVLRSLKPSIRSPVGMDFTALLKQAVQLLNINDTTRLEAAMLTLHSLHIVAQSKLGSSIAAWEEQFLLWSEENRILMREALDLFETMCTKGCKPLTIWYFQHALSRTPMLPFSALLGRYTPAHVRKSTANLINILTTLKNHGKPMSCKEFQREARKIPKPAVQRERPSVAKTSSFIQTVLRDSRKVARCVALVAETMTADDKDVFLGSLGTLPKEPSLDEATDFLQYPMQKRRKPNE
jgi:hypothetical protein